MQRRPRAPFLLASLAAALVAVAARAEAPQVFAIRDAQVVPVSSAPIQRGTVVIRDGLIEAVGADVKIPGDAEVIDGKGLTVYPGLIDCGSDIGLPGATAAPAPAAATRGTGRRTQTPATPVLAAPAPAEEPVSNLNAFYQVADNLSDGGAKAEAARAAGITTVLTTPQRGIFSGQSAVANLNGDKASMIVRTPVFMHVHLSSTGGFREYPGSLMGILAYIRQTFLDARRYREMWDLYHGHVRELRRPETSRGLEALQPVTEGKLPLVVPGNSAPEIMRALKIAEESGAKIILSGGLEAGSVAKPLHDRNVPVLFSLKFPERSRDAAPDAEESLRDLQRRVKAPKVPEELRKAGVKFVFTSEGIAPADYLRNAARIVKSGLPAEVALRAMTLDAAQLLGVSEQLGSIEKGKIANLLVTDGDLFADRTRVRYTFVDGHRFEAPAPAAATSQVSLTGRWQVTVDAAAGKTMLVLNLTQTGNQLTGTAMSAMNSAPITDGVVTGSSFRLKAMVRLGEMEVAATFSGTVEGSTMKGRVNVNNQDVEFNGMRAPANLEDDP